MKLAAGIMIGIGMALFAWSLSRLTSDAIGMALGMLLGVLAGVPSAALVLVSLRSADDRPAPDYEGHIDAAVTYADQVTPYTHVFRRVAGMPALPDRQAQIDELRSYLAVLEAEGVR